ncbi:Hypothetical_protein [Hexamita inflata]|uniref:Hypothetical_protein n=1 Tax=Hexamita inflata TaxID=28002 RepID=A0ABP1HME2_9EUKA
MSKLGEQLFYTAFTDNYYFTQLQEVNYSFDTMNEVILQYKITGCRVRGATNCCLVKLFQIKSFTAELHPGTKSSVTATKYVKLINNNVFKVFILKQTHKEISVL